MRVGVKEGGVGGYCTQLGPGWPSEVTAIAVLALAGASSIEEIMTIPPIGLPQTAEGAFLYLLFFHLRACVQYARTPHSHALGTAIN